MSKRGFFEELGLAQPENKVNEIIVAEDKLEVVAPKKETGGDLDSAPEPSDTGEGINEQLANVHTTLAGLEGTVKASASVIQAQEIVARLTELKGRLDKIEEALKAATCPSCGKIVGWHDLEVKQSIKPSYFPVFNLPPFIKPDMESYKECPACGYKEEVEEEQE